jgi:tetratricopeptide (TPR) repeat protein
MSSRQKHLEELLKIEPNDPFLRYGLAMEHKKAGRLDQALEWFGKTLEADATYCYAWYQQGQVHQARGEVEAARSVYERGIAAARQCNDNHAAGEMQAALDELEA